MSVDSSTDSEPIAGIPAEQIFEVVRWSKHLRTDQYVEGFRAIEARLSDEQKRILRSLYDAPKHAAYATQLAKAASITGGHSVVNLRYGKIGRLFSQTTGHLPDFRKNETPRWWSIISRGHRTKFGFIWQLLPEVAQALEHLGWVSASADIFTEESSEGILFEGAVTQIKVNAYERNRLAREKCIAHYRAICVLCGFDFEARYGAAARGFIHVHHIVPLSSIGSEYRIDPVRDLRPVCANCHAVIHLGGKCRTLDEVKALLRSAPRQD